MTLTFKNTAKKSADSMLNMWRRSHPNCNMTGLSIDNGAITITYEEKEKPDESTSENSENPVQ